jgi:hypothetical protein
MRRSPIARAGVCPAIAACLLAAPALAQNAPGTSAIWHDRGDAAALDLATGPGGKDREPGIDFTFVGESISGTSPKFDVVDERGIRWKVKLGEEARSESAASRLLWAAGYTVDEDYYRPQIRVRGLIRLARGGEFVTDGDTVRGARLERDVPGGDSIPWDWYDNPFVGTREFNGLKVMMALVNNWDLKAINNSATGTSTGGGQYGVTDLGATFGRTGNALNRSKGVLKDYSDTSFIDKVTPAYVDFRMNSRPFFLTVFAFRNYRLRTRMESLVKRVPIADARWIGDRLGELSAPQIGDAFRAAGFSPGDVEAYTRIVMQRIATLQRLGDGIAAAPTPAVTDARRCLESTCRQVPLRETLTAIDVGTRYAHAIFGGFEQGSGIGGGVQLTTAGAIPGVEFRATALRTTRRDRRWDLEAFLPNIAGSRNHADVWFSQLHRRTDFYGVGPRTSEDLDTEFTVDRRSYQGSFYRDLTEHLQGGIYTQLMDTHGVLRADPTDSQILTYGTFLSYDTRDNGIGLTRGLNLFGRVASADGIGRRTGAAKYGWMEVEFDARAHAPLGSPHTSLLLRSRGQFKTPAGGGNTIPYYDLSWLGGRQYLRGYHSYRFRDNNVILVSSELQQTVYSITNVRGVEVFASADTGQVWGTHRFDSRNWQSGVGGGLQYRHSRTVAARVEASRSRERVAFYASVSRGF